MSCIDHVRSKLALQVSVNNLFHMFSLKAKQFPRIPVTFQTTRPSAFRGSPRYHLPWNQPFTIPVKYCQASTTGMSRIASPDVSCGVVTYKSCHNLTNRVIENTMIYNHYKMRSINKVLEDTLALTRVERGTFVKWLIPMPAQPLRVWPLR